MIADTGCQRQVAGSRWHENRSLEVQPLEAMMCSEKCRFSFGPNEGVPSDKRYIYPAGLGGVFVALGVSSVAVNAPALFSRPSFTVLGAIPNVVTGIMHYTALQTQSKLCLSPCGHLAIRIDEWPQDVFVWPPERALHQFPDVWSPHAASLETVTLQKSTIPVRSPPHATVSVASDFAMDAKLASSDVQGVGVCVDSQADGDHLCGLQHEAPSQGCGAQELLPEADSHHNAVKCDRTDPVRCERAQVHQRPGSMSTCVRSPIIRSGRKEHEDLRPMRSKMGEDHGRQHDSLSPKGQSKCQDATDSQARSQDQGHGQGQGQERRVGWMAKALSLLASVFAGAAHNYHIEDGFQGSSFVSSQHVRSGDSYVEPPLHGHHGPCCSPGRLRSGLDGGTSISTRRMVLPTRRSGSSGREFGRSSPDAPSGSGDGRGGRVLSSQTGELSAAKVPRSKDLRGQLPEDRALHGFSADNPLTHDDMNAESLRSGSRKRLSGNARSLQQVWKVENQIYEGRVGQARLMRNHRYDIVEIYAGMANVTAEALERGLRALQPVDAVHGIRLDTKTDHQRLRQMLKTHRPFLILWEIRCDPWSNINHLNYTLEELEVIRAEQKLSLHEMRLTIEELQPLGCHFLLENPWGTPFWQQDDIQKILQLPGVQLKKGSMCQFGLRGKEGLLLRKDTGWASDLEEVLNQVAVPCSTAHPSSSQQRGHHEHEPCMGGNAKRAQIYTRALAKAVVNGLCSALQHRGDERWLLPKSEEAWTWTCGLDAQPCSSEQWSHMWTSPTDHCSTDFSIFYVDINRDETAWQPLLQEAKLRLEDKVSSSAIVKPNSAFFQQIRDLVPWTIHQAQIVRNPKVRRLPQQLFQTHNVTHRAAALLTNDGRIVLETEDVQKEMPTGVTAKFDTPVAFGILVYGEAPETSLVPQDNVQPEPAAGAKALKDQVPSSVQAEDMLEPWQPGFNDIRFDVQDGSVPKWVQNVLRRIHTNLGHPSNEALVRYLAQANASGQALLGAKKLQCSVCTRTRPPRQPRPSKAIQSRRFNDRVLLDIVYLKNIHSETFPYLNILDDATTYNVFEPLPDRSETTVVQTLLKGWFRHFGFPDSMLVDAEGAFRGVNFDQLISQAGIMVRCVPPDAHWQLGKAERHGQAVKFMVRKLVSQFAALSQHEMDLVVNMCLHAKNTLTRRSGASPCQWVFGRQPKLPAALLSEPEAIEAKQTMDNSEALLQIEAVRHEAMKSFIDYDFNQSLRRAMLRKGRPWRGPLEVGQRVAYFRHRTVLDGEGTSEGYRQGLIIGLDPGPSGSVWLRNNKGRVVQAAREQIRSVEGEELWIPNSDDIRSLQDLEIDLADKHARAFNQSGPTSAADRRIADQIDVTLDPSGAPISPELAISPPAILIPVPAPAERRESRDSITTAASAPSGSGRPAPETPVIYQPPTPALPPIPEVEEIPNDEPNRTSSKTTSGADTGSLLQLENVPQALQDAGASVSGGSQTGRGVKRFSEDTTETLHAAVQETDPAAPEAAPAAATNLLLYCKQCGTSRNDNTASSVSCSRCMADDFVDNPRFVISWFDEVEQREAFQQHTDMNYNNFYKKWMPQPSLDAGFLSLPRDEDMEDLLRHESYIVGVGQTFSKMPEYDMDTSSLWSVATRDKENNSWTWHHVFDNIDVSSDVLPTWLHDDSQAETFLLRHSYDRQDQSSCVLPWNQQPDFRHFRRHARHCLYLTGWDGSPPELQTGFQHQSFMSAYHHLCYDVAHENYMVSSDVLQDIQHDVRALEDVSQDDLHSLAEDELCSVFNTNNEMMVMDESSDEEDSNETSGRALKQALKREVPWRSISDQHWDSFLESLREEWAEWEKWSSCKPVWLREGEIDPKLILKSRVCFRWKPKDGGKWFKPKSRIVIQGYLDPHLPLLSRDAPVLSRISFMLILQWASCFGVDIYNADCKSAFLQGLPDDERPTAIYMRPPQDGLSLAMKPEWRLKECLYQLSAPVYGQANAPRRWFLYVLGVLLKLNWCQHSLDPCCFLQRLDGQVVALLGLHVDDIIICCLPGYERLLDEVKASFTWGSEWEVNDFIFVGRHVQKQPDGGFTLDQTHYVSDISRTKITMSPEEKLSEHPELITEFRSGIGSLQWLSGTTRGDLASSVSLLQKAHGELKVADLVEINTILKYVRATATAHIKINPIDPHSAMFVAYGDSGWANAPGGKSQGGLVIVMTDRQALHEERPASMIEWKSFRHQRVLRSTLAAEAASLDRAQDTGNFVGCVFTEMIDPEYLATKGVSGIEVVPITDARSLWDAVHRLSTSFAEKRVEIDVAGLRQTCRNLRWVPTELQWADCMTKINGKLRDRFKDWMASPVVTLVESKSAADMAEGDNGAWRKDKVHNQKKSLAVTFS